jgi:hypothetical protein
MVKEIDSAGPVAPKVVVLKQYHKCERSELFVGFYVPPKGASRDAVEIDSSATGKVSGPAAMPDLNACSDKENRPGKILPGRW